MEFTILEIFVRSERYSVRVLNNVPPTLPDDDASQPPPYDDDVRFLRRGDDDEEDEDEGGCCCSLINLRLIQAWSGSINVVGVVIVVVVVVVVVNGGAEVGPEVVLAGIFSGHRAIMGTR